MQEEREEPKIYLLPNLMTAGNLCCGFFAVLTIFNGMQMDSFGTAYPMYQRAIMLIFASCIFDLLDGRLARLGGQESPFGQEFDSIADVVSFGMAPALLVSKAVLFPLSEKLGSDNKIIWAIAFIYLLCGAMRLARFNCLANMPKKEGDSMDFRGIPIPMAAGFIASITFLIIHLYESDKNLGIWSYVLAAVMLGLSALMLSNVRYPSFKKVDWSTKGSLWGILLGGMVIMLLVIEATRWYAPTLIFSCYLIYGLVRPFLSKKVQKTLAESVDG
ncbi:CDP-diacylglycerol--serine O-phosphatidyltransferase [Rubritalea squalenifaciens DSM 18772]|uniref:CDP-diacylglycerol--serine O-phosphatidyltransferase n=2 Tax=Rubritalea TaxID=361050 RepID=A0A1M6NIH4_9BACT|nr:CDP-diacylglycerol--serine O-phosphatidyltransferase [Rubritalea squalenifaciens]SHJ95424.1 CDP-diacylglycerol--serine O-phosphatidyltransferase [Rubritalea squalenifaciens DSM 18772]